MSLSRTAGAAGTVALTVKNTAGQLVTPVSLPTAKWYTDTGRTAGEVTLTVTGSGSSYTATYTAGQAPATPSSRYLKFTVEVSAGVFDVDADDDISFVDAVVSVDATDYTTLALLKASLGITDTGDDAALARAITTASRAIDKYTGTQFYATTESRTFFPSSSGDVWVDRFTSTSGLTVQTGTDGTFPTTVTSTDVVPWPPNAASKGDAFCRLLIPTCVLPMSSLRPTVKVTATWGFSACPEAVADATVIKAAHLFRRKDSPDGVAGSGEFGVVRISRYEDPDVVSLLAPYRDAGIA